MNAMFIICNNINYLRVYFKHFTSMNGVIEVETQG